MLLFGLGQFHSLEVSIGEKYHPCILPVQCGNPVAKHHLKCIYFELRFDLNTKYMLWF